MTREAMQMALEALEYGMAYNGWDDLVDRIRQHELKANAAITALRQALANEALDRMAENERELGIQMQPVKMVAYNCVCGRKMYFESNRGVVAPKREWVGLTDEEKKKTWYAMQNIMGWYSFQEIANAIEQALKDRNT